MKVLIADDHAIVREGLKHIVKRMNDTAAIDEAANGADALKLIEENQYALTILDISMPGLSGLDILKILKDRKDTTRTLILSVHPQEQYAIRALHLGASGYLCKDSINEELETAIKTIISGDLYIPRSLAEKIIFTKHEDVDKLPHEKLSEREFQIMRMLAEGKSIKTIAADLYISDKTVTTYRYRILTKMKMKHNAELTRYAIKNDLIV